MKIQCQCGELIHDLDSNAFYITARADFHAAHDAMEIDIVDALLKGNIQQEAAYMKLRTLMPKRAAWQCPTCGRLYMNGDDGELTCYVPEEHSQ